MSTRAHAQKTLGRREVRSLIERAKREGRSFEDLFLEMYPGEETILEEDDCRPIDGVSVRSYDEGTVSTDYGTRTTDSFRPVQPPRRPESLSEISVATEDDNTYVRDLKSRADFYYRRRLLGEVLEHWRDQLQIHLQHTEAADRKYDEKVARNCLNKMTKEFYDSDDLERKRRLRMFLAWKDRKLAIWAIHAWIIRHRENVVRKRSEDGQNIRAASSILSKWHGKMMQIQQQKSNFRQFFFACKYGRRWIDIVSDRRIARTMATLEQKYHAFRREKEAKMLRRSISGWNAKAASAVAMEVTAVQHFQETQQRQTRDIAYKAITTMYVTTAEVSNMELAADQKYETGVKSRILADDGQWRSRTRLAQDQEQRADLFHEFKGQGKAQLAFRMMRRTAARSKQLDDEADAHRIRTDSNNARHALRKWRSEAAAKRGEIVVQEAPATPAARLTALRQFQNQRF